MNKPKTENGKKICEFLLNAETINPKEFVKQFGYHPTQARPRYVKKNFYKTKENGVWIWKRKKSDVTPKKTVQDRIANSGNTSYGVILTTIIELAQRQERMEALLLKMVEGKKWAKYWQKKKEGKPIQQIDENAWIEDMAKDLQTSRTQTQGLLDTLKLDKEVQMRHIYEQFGCDIARLITIFNRFLHQTEKYVGGTISISAFSVRVK
jgi:hypothetical protein